MKSRSPPRKKVSHFKTVVDPKKVKFQLHTENSESQGSLSQDVDKAAILEAFGFNSESIQAKHTIEGKYLKPISVKNRTICFESPFLRDLSYHEKVLAEQSPDNQYYKSLKYVKKNDKVFLNSGINSGTPL